MRFNAPRSSRSLARPLAAVVAGLLPLAVVPTVTAAAPAVVARSAPAAASTLRVADLTTDLLVRPLGTDSARPRLAWTTPGSVRGARQTAYRVQVATTAAGLAAGAADVWDSGRVASARSQVAYAGPALSSATRYHWRVQVWDGAGKVSAWSPASWWETGLLSGDDWSADWVAPASAAAGGSYLRGEVEVPADVVSARLYVSGRGSFERGPDGQGICCEQQFGLARGIYEPWLNGQRVSDTQVESTSVDTRVRALYRTYDVTDLVREGDNALGLMIGEDSDVLAQLRIVTTDGVVELASGEDWTSAPGPVVRAHRFHGETYDARRELAGWSEPDATGTWSPVRVSSTETGRLDAAVFEPMRVVADHRAVSVTEPAEGVYVLDFGQNRAGWTRLRANLPAGTTVTLKHGERLNGAGRVDNGVIGAQQTSTFTSTGGDVDWEPSFVYAGFRWVEVTGLTEAPGTDTVVAREVHNDVRRTGSFSSSDAMLNRLHAANVQTQVNGLHAVPEDTPTREKRGWTADAHIAAEATIDNFAMAPFYENWAEESVAAQRPDGRVPDIVPTEPSNGWRDRSDPAWASSHVLIPAYLEKHYGDTTALVDHYDSLKAYVDYVATTTEGGLVTKNTGHWGDDWLGVETTDSRLFRTGFYYWDLRIVERAARLADRPADAADLAQRAEAAADAINAEFLDEAEASYGPSQFANAFPLTLGIVPDGLVDGVVQTLVDDVVDERGGHFTGGLPGIKYIPEALAMHGRSDVVLDVVRSKEKPGWGYMLEHGPGTIWEDWEGASSLNHPMFTSIDHWLYDSVAGIRQAEGSTGYDRVVIAPQVMDEVQRASASILTPHGRLASAWAPEGGRTVQRVTVPVGTVAEVHVPASRTADVVEGNRPVAGRAGVLGVRQQGDRVVVTVGSGSYAFAADRGTGDLLRARAHARSLGAAVRGLSSRKARAVLVRDQRQVLAKIEGALRARGYGREPVVRTRVATALSRLQRLERDLRQARARRQVSAASVRLVSTRAQGVRRSLSGLATGYARISLTPTVVGAPVSASTFDVSTVVANGGRKPLTRAAVGLRVPDSWRVQVLRALPRFVGPGGRRVATFRVTVPAAQPPGETDLTLALSGRRAGTRFNALSVLTVDVGSPLAITALAASPRVVEPDALSTSVVATVTNRGAQALRVTARGTTAPAGWTWGQAPAVVVPARGTAPVSATLTRGEEAAAGGPVDLEITAGGVVWDSARTQVFVRGAGCEADPLEEACLTDEQVLLHSFESGTEGWVAGDGTSSVASVTSMANGPGTARLGQRLLEAVPTSTVAGGEWRTVSVDEPEPVPYRPEQALVVHLDGYGGGPGGPYEARVVVTDSAGVTTEVVTAVSPDAWNQVRVPLAEWTGADIARIEVSYRARGDQPWAGRFQVDAVLLDATEPPPSPAGNLAAGRPVTAKAGLNCCSWGTANLVDGTRVSTTGSRGFTSDPPNSSRDAEQWVQVDLGSVQQVGSVWLWPRTATAGEPVGNGGAGFPADFQLQLSDDGSTWQTVSTQAGQASDGSVGIGYDVTGSGRYVRLLVTRLGRSAPDEAQAALFRLQLAELEVFAPQP
ncbi:family 78 glycoside hydrolase catalytic domain [Nocardioides sp. SYSU D00038]|uniref:family 78 glycoside hydrolase catalytic domain n=1 Tax=Nocardioides sp. SYSU D00038 TaxID=2812554 RepID=UPI001967589F|nr:family 78 glycoside hydrolase catalytic domain [Nocardioides sp. SYSU D00038]